MTEFPISIDGPRDGDARDDGAVSHWSSWLVLGALLVVLMGHTAGVVLDFAAALRDPLQLDYGEGIVWQQALLIPGAQMYRSGTDLPFIVFHYPPLYYFLVRAVALLQPDMLVAGRLVSIVTGSLSAALVGGIVLTTVRRPDERLGMAEFGVAAAMGMLALGLPAFRLWMLVMRVDMPAIMFALAALLVGMAADGRFRGTALALVLAVIAVYGKQTQVPAGLTVFLIAVLRHPRAAIGAAAVAGGLGLAALGLMQHLTGGGFLHNIIGNNINRMSIRYAYLQILRQQASYPFIALMAGAFVTLGRTVLPSVFRVRLRQVVREVWALRQADAPTARRAMLLLHFVLSGMMLLTLMKAGGNFNYLLEWLCSGCALIGVLLVDLVRTRRAWFCLVAVGVLLAVMTLPMRELPDSPPEAELAAEASLVARIAAADKPVASENMTLLMRAGKPVIFEPSIVTELALVGRWDEAPLVAMMRQGGFAFVITTDDVVGGQDRRTPAVDAAMRAAYPRVERVASGLWLHLPAVE